MTNTAGASLDEGRGARWLSRGFEDLEAELNSRQASRADPCDFDLIIVGSGYGGSLAAAKLAGRVDPATGEPLRICVLERGREYLAGMFPVSEAQLPGHVRFNTADAKQCRGRSDALLDLRIGPDVNALVANGLGGGSLINAGVMARAQDAVLTSSAWPRAFRSAAVLTDYYAQAEKLLAPAKDRPLPSFEGDERPPAKFTALKRFGNGTTQGVPLSISIHGGSNAADVELRNCLRCGDCATGCNHQAKNSLDQNCLVLARRRGAEIFCGATVTHVSRQDAVWTVHVVHTDDDLRKRGQARELKARRVILSAGSFGSTEILKRSERRELRFSARLGERFSTNGDLLAVAYGQNAQVNAVADETQPFGERGIGPTITGMIDQRTGTGGIVIEEFAIPGPLRRLFEESFTLAHTLAGLGRPDPQGRHTPKRGGDDPCGVSAGKIANTQVFGVMGHDGAAGTLELVPDSTEKDGNGAIRVRWPGIRAGDGKTVFDEQTAALAKLNRKSRLGGVVLPNPIWRLLPPALDSMMSIPRGPATTVHPLGGCAMGDDANSGVVDEYGRVFDGSEPQALHEGLFVLDGSIVPCSLGINPALTIAALTLRSVAQLTRDLDDGDSEPSDTHRKLPRPLPVAPASDVRTTIKVLERVTGVMDLALQEGEAPSKRMVELTIAFAPACLRDLARLMQRELVVNEADSYIRIFDVDCWNELWDTGATEQRFEACALFAAPLTGRMTLLDRAPSTRLQRFWRGFVAWLINRGMRDMWQRWAAREAKPARRGTWNPLRTICTFVNVASHAGEMRVFDYELKIGAPRRSPSGFAASQLGNGRIHTVKRLTYSRRCNPWRQLSEMSVEAFPQIARLDEHARPVLKLEPKFFARHQKHLMQFAQQRDHATALFDMASFLLCILRILLRTHVWSFRLPDARTSRNPRRLPGIVPGLPPPVYHTLTVGRRANGGPVNIVLTRYSRPDTTKKPIVLIHGFSASGTTFAHHALRPGLAQYLWERGRDVWVLDLRTSSALETARDEWTFEQVACVDIPRAFERMRHETGALQIDVVAQCMGATMLSMAILDKGAQVEGALSPEERAQFLASVGAVVLSQISPMIVFSPENIFKGYATNYVQQAIGNATFELRPDEETLTTQLLDRLLSTMPYPGDDEFDTENPPVPWRRTPWVRTRHRMDAWFGRVFNSPNVAPEVLEHIDDMFGTINLRTTFQTIHFARQGSITSRKGRNIFISHEQLQRWKSIPTLSIHGAQNGLADPATVTRMRALMQAAEVDCYRWHVAEGFGHQDCLIGRDSAAKVFPLVEQFLNDPTQFVSTPPLGETNPCASRDDRLAKGSSDELRATQRIARRGPVADAPWLGPVFGSDAGFTRVVVAEDRKLGAPRGLLVAPVRRVDDRWISVAVPSFHAIRPCSPAFAGVEPAARWYEALVSPVKFASEAALVLLAYDQFNVITPDAWANFILKANNSAYAHFKLTSDLASTSPKLQTHSPSPQLPFKASAPIEISFDNLLYIDPRDFTLTKMVEDFLMDCSRRKLDAALVQRPPATTTAKADGSLCFALGSCQYPPGPLDEELAAGSYARLVALLETTTAHARPRFLVLAGDQVYADATAGLMDPVAQDDRYELPYEKWLSTPAVREVLKRIPAYMMLDDHEIADNWAEGHDTDPSPGKAAYLKFQRTLNPPTPTNGGVSLWFASSLHGFEFFFADTRTERQARSVDGIDTARIMGDKQFAALLAWLDTHKNSSKPIFIVSPSILLPRRVSSLASKAGALRSDAWDGYPHSLHQLLAYIAHQQIRNVVFLSGDEHHSCVATVGVTPLDGAHRPAGAEVTTHSIHGSALYAPFVFANGDPMDLAGADSFTFEVAETTRTYACRCRVETRFLGTSLGGFATINCIPESNNAWRIDCSFDLYERRESIAFGVPGRA